MKLSVRTESDKEEENLEVEVKNLSEAKNIKTPGKKFLIVCHHDEKEYKPCKKIPLEDVEKISVSDEKTL